MHLNFARPGLVLLAAVALACSDDAASPAPDGGVHDAGDGVAGDGSTDAVVETAPAPADAPVETAPAPAAPDATDTTAAGDAGAAEAAAPDVPPAVSTLCSVPAAWVPLPYAVIAAAYSRSLERMVMVGDDQALHIYDPASCVNRRVPLPRTGLSVSLHPSGKEAVVGHDGRLTVVDLMSESVALLDVPVPVTHVAFDAQRRVHAFTQARRLVSHPLHTVSVPDGTLRTGAKLPAGGQLKMTPDGLGLLWVSDDATSSQEFFRVDPQTGTAGMNANRFNTFRVCHDLFPTDDSKQIVTACGTVLRSLPGTPEDLTFQAAMEGVSQIRHLDSHAASSRVVVIPRSDNFATEEDTVIRVHDGKFFNFIKTVPLPAFMEGATAVGTAAHGRHVFVRGDGTRYHVIAAAATFVGRRPIHAVATLDAEGAQMPVAAPLPLPPESTSFPPVVERPQTVHPLAFDIIDAAYSPSAGRVLVASTQPASAVHFLDPDTGQSEALPLPGPARRVVVRPDGAVAAVVFDGAIRFIEVATRATIRELPRAPMNVSFAAPPRVLLDTATELLSWLSLDTGTTTPAGSIFGGGQFWVQATFTRPGFYLSSGRLQRYPDGNQTASLYDGFDLGLFNEVHSTSRYCGSRFWLLDGDKRLLLDCARVFQVSETASEDLRYLGSLDRVDRVSHGTYVQSLGRYVSIPGTLRIDGSFVSSEAHLVVHDPRTLGLEARVPLALIPGDPFRSTRGRFVFEGRTSKRVHVLADSNSDPRSRALIVVDL